MSRFTVPTSGVPPLRYPGLELPNDRERTAHLLRTKQGLTDEQIGEAMNCSRVTVNRLRSRFKQKLNRLRVACATSDNCSLLEALCA